MRNDIIRAGLKKVPFMLHSATMDSLLEMANSETPRSETPSIEVANNSVIYQVINNTAIISVDGAMHKKDIGGMCSSVVAYPAILQAIDKAEAEESIDTTIFRVDTPGGSVFGADEVEERIYNSKNKTITFFENIGASGGIYIFMASDEVYASETTMLGSIGVVVSYIEEDEATKKRRVEVVSKNAQNKRCSLNGNCKEEIETMINTHESIFYDRVMKNTGFSEEKIKTTFNNGGMIFAKEAQSSGFINKVISFSELMKSLNLNSGSTIVPTASASVNLISDDTTEINQGADMKFDTSSPEATESTKALFATLVANKATIEGRNDTLKVDLETAKTALEAKTDEMVKLVAEHDSKLSEAEEKLGSFKTETIARVQEGVAYKATADVIVNAINAEDTEKATSLIMAHVESDGGTRQTPNEQVKGSWDGYSFNRGEK